MKNTIRLALISASIGASASAAPFMAIGDGAELFLTGSLGIRADDNIFLALNDESDLIFDLAPGVDITFGKNSQMQGALTLKHTWSNYSDNSNLNTNLFNGSFSSRYDDGKLKLGFNLGYNELNQNTPDIRGLTRRDAFNVGGNAEVEISQITSIGAGVTFNHDNYKRGNPYTDSDSLTVPIDFFYKWTPKVDLSVGYRYRDYQVDIGSDSTDHFFNVGARGEFTPKLSGKFQIGLNTRELDRGGDENGLGLAADFTYTVTPKTNLTFGAGNDYSTTPTGQQQENFDIRGGVTSKIADDWSVGFNLSWRATDYGTRTDDFVEAGITSTYIINTHANIVASYTHRDYASVLSASEFKNNVFSIAANFRY